MKTLLFIFLYLLSGPILNSQINDAQTIVNRCIEVHGGKNYNKAKFSFDFRKYHYVYEYNNGQYIYERHLKDQGIIDRLNNHGFERFILGKKENLSDKDAERFANSVNSVHYFTFLPFFLNDKAVNKRLIGESKIDGENYYEAEVTFSQKDGGKDYEDIYVYWIHKEKLTLDYLAYSFHVNGGGVRFRSAYNRRVIDGIIFQDYVNYKHDKSTPVHQLDEYFEKGALEELSKIELKNIQSL